MFHEKHFKTARLQVAKKYKKKMETLEGQFCLAVECQRQTNLKPEQVKGFKF